MPLVVREEWRGGSVVPLFRTRAREALRSMAPEVEAYCRGLTPVDTGALRSTVTAFVPDDGRPRLVLEAGGPAPEFGNYVVYAHLVHDGTDTMPARPFVTQTMTAFASRLRRAAGGSLR